ncbi:hypothetical protein DERF_001197 [Dermatophagoides farinae]|uniref:Uncharacterized protein n=1 Tax=Dermatophagoides farinae TaxID=6954 RepID=A0A922LAX7_DERFA|nr:hypothetical protein DERF_001197 [Dermatophagoides farinae]
MTLHSLPIRWIVVYDEEPMRSLPLSWIVATEDPLRTLSPSWIVARPLTMRSLPIGWDVATEPSRLRTLRPVPYHTPNYQIDSEYYQNRMLIF